MPRRMAPRSGRPFAIALLCSLATSGCKDPARAALRELEKRGVEASSSSLLEAVTSGDTETTRLLLESGVYAGRRDPSGDTPLLLALQQGETGIAGLLIDHGADPDTTNAEGVSPVGFAVYRRDDSLLSLLLERGAKPDGLTPDGEQVLPWAVRFGTSTAVHALVEAGADPHYRDKAGNPLIHLAIEAGHRELAVELIALGADPAQPNAAGESVLSSALRHGWTDHLEQLTRAGADPNLPDRDGFTPVDRAFATRDFPLLRKLTELGGLPAGGSWAGVLWKALQSGDREGARCLLSLGASPDLPSDHGTRPTEHAIASDDAATLHLLLSYGADSKGLFGMADQPGRRHLGTLLLAHGAMPANPPPPSIDTPLAAAIRAGDLRTVRHLLDHGCSPHAPLGEGQRPLALAVALGRHRITEELVRRGADPNAPLAEPAKPAFIRHVEGGTMRWLLRNDGNITPLMLAANSGSPETAKVLLAAGARTGVWTRRHRLWPINIAARKSDVAMMRVLLGKDPHAEQRRIVVSLSEQKARLYDSSGQELFVTKISTGRKGFQTPTGTFAITNKYRNWTSTLYDASMPFFQRFSCGDFGFHQGVVPGYPASHGCIRVPAGNASRLFALTELGDRVEIHP